MKIEGKKVLVTGANRGIGLAICEALAREGVNLVMTMRKPDGSFVKSMEKLGAKSVTIKKIDLSSFKSIQEFIDEIKREKVSVDILVNNAGVLTGGLLEEQNIEEVYSMIQVNLMAYIHLTAGILPQMLKKGYGKIVNNASISGILNLPSASTYTAAKMGVVGFTRSLAQELSGTGVSTLLLITPGVETRMFGEVRQIYKDHLNVAESGGTITPEAWAKKVVSAIKDDRRELWPGGGVGVVGRLYQLFPQLVRFGTTRIFKR